MYRGTATLLFPLFFACTLGGANAVLPGGDQVGDESSSDMDDSMPSPGDSTDDGPANDGSDMADDGPGSDSSDGGDDGDTAPEAGTPGDDGAIPGDDAGTDAGSTSGCDPSAPCAPAGCSVMEHDGHTYFFCSDPLTFDEARSTCQAAGTDLVVIDDEAENAFVQAGVSGDTWLGLSDRDVEKTFSWVSPGQPSFTGVAASYVNWNSGEPQNCADPLEVFSGGEDCVVLRADGTWNDVACGMEGQCVFSVAPRPFVCESY